jgi:hypothetical protein
MSDEKSPQKPNFSADWLVHGVLTKLGDSFDRLTGRKWVPSSSLAASELIERVKKLLDDEAKDVAGKGKVVPHNIKLKMQWDKFAEGDSLENLRAELLTATVDHINDSLYYTYAPVSFEIKPDYFVEGVKLYVSFDKFSDDESDVEQNVTLPAINISETTRPVGSISAPDVQSYVARYTINGDQKQTTLEFPVNQQRSVGRTGTSDLMLNDASVSKIHASLVADTEGVLSVADTGSTNGTFINGQRIAYGKAVRLHDGDRVTFGSIEVKFESLPNPLAASSNDGATGMNDADEMSKGNQ